MRIITALLVTILLTSTFAFANGRPSHIHEVYFEGTNFELHIFRIQGRSDGKTMLIIGGIQGDEPGGFLSADLYSDLALEKGNLIVVPRANMKSVILFNRGPDGDMNRLFADETPSDIQGEVVAKLKELMGEADILLNLHDGWGFHNPNYIDKSRNPNRFGQSIIIDEAEYTCNDGRSFNLKTMAEDVLTVVNSKIEDEKLHLHLFNTETGSDKTQYKDMRKTATWYALTGPCIPAFGIEGSKSVKSIEQNVLFHNYAVNEFMRIMDIIPEQPRVMIIKPEMDTAYLKINDNSIQVKSGETITITAGDTVEIISVESNYTRGITGDILGYGTLNDMGKPLSIAGDTKILFRKDNEKMSEIRIKTLKPSLKSSLWIMLLKIDGKYKTALNGEQIFVPKGSVVELVKLFSDTVYDAKVPLNMKGWVPANVVRNNGDDRGYEIKLPDSRMLKKYSKDGKGNIYPVVAGDDKNPHLTIDIVIGN